MRLSRTVLFVFLPVLLAGCVEPRTEKPPEPETRRITKSGPVIGTAGKHGGHQWLGIPYARPPLNERRWKAPDPPSGWNDARAMTSHASPCPQLASPLGGVTAAPEGTPVGKEDCLYLDIYAPAFEPGGVPDGPDRRPVMVWIHGGGNVIGHTKLYDGSQLASTEDVIVVTVQYRLGPLGWFRHSALRGSGVGPRNRSGNYALLDLIRSLKWVKQNIARFGGDPDNITVFGESAGGRNVFNLMMSPLASGLFDRAIVQSGAMALTEPKRAENYVDDGGGSESSGEILLELLKGDGRAKNRREARRAVNSMDADTVASYLRGKSPRELLSVYESSELGLPIDPPRVFADGHVLPTEDPLDVFANSNRYNDVPIMLGSNRDETKLFLSQDPRWTSQLLGFIPRPIEPDLYELVAQYTSDLWKAHAVDRPAAVLSNAQDDPVYAYRFDWDELPTLFGTDLSFILGAAHGFEIPFVFGDFDFGGDQGKYLFTENNRPGRMGLSRAMRTYWAEFARNDNPNGNENADRPHWPSWDSNPSGQYLILDSLKDGGIRPGNTTHTRRDLLQKVNRDIKPIDQRQRCVLYRAMATTVGGVTRRDFEERDRCRQFNWEDYPWR